MKCNNRSLQGRVAIVTGASSGIGKSLVCQLVNDGAKCLAIGRREDRLKQLEEEFTCEQVSILPLDLRKANAASDLIGSIPGHWSTPDILINNAGLALNSSPAQECNLEDWETMIDTNINSLVRLTHAVLPLLLDANRADIINMSSVAATYPYPGGNVYGATKAFVRQFSLGLRADLLGKNVRVSSIEPGMCETEFSLVRFNGDKQAAERVYKNMQALGPDDVAEAIVGILQLPPHVCVNTIELMPTQQAFGPFSVHRSIAE